MKIGCDDTWREIITDTILLIPKLSFLYNTDSKPKVVMILDHKLSKAEFSH